MQWLIEFTLLLYMQKTFEVHFK